MQILTKPFRRREIWLCLLLALFSLLSCVRPEDYSLYRLALLEDRGLIDVSLREYAEHEKPQVRRAAATTIGRVGSTDHFYLLQRLIEDQDPSVREQAAFACGLIKNHSATAFLLPHLSDENPPVRARTIEALGRIGGKDLPEKIAPLLKDRSEEVRNQAALALWRLGDKKAAPDLILAMETAKGGLRYNLSYALMRLATPECFEVFGELLGDPDPEVRVNATRGLGNLKDPRALLWVVNLLRDPDQRVATEAVRALGKTDDKRAAEPLLELLSSSNNENLLSEAIKVLGNLGDKGALEKLTGFLSSDSQILKGEALVAVAKLGSAEVLEDLKELLKDDSWYVRAKIAEGLREIGGEEVERLLLVMLADRDRRVQMAAVEAIGYSVSKRKIDGKRGLGRVESILLESTDFALRSLCAEALAKTRDPKYIYPLIKSYKFTPRSHYSELKRAIISALVELATPGEVDVRIENLLLEALGDSDPLVRREAHAASIELSLQQKYNPGEFRSKLTFANYFEVYHNPNRLLRARIFTPKGEIVIELLQQYAPRTVANFIHLTNSRFYDGLIFHRVVPNFVIQGGCPRGDGWGGPEYTIREEINELEFERGTVGMATSGKDTGGSQFFICHSRQPHLDGRYTAFGRVISGIEVVDKIVIGDVIEKVEILTSRF
jgi:HEAT repeat protein/cyclophilin family peptidyl-prolyl cis-trans isomerase